MDLNVWKKNFIGYFDLSEFLLPQAEAEAGIREGVSFRGINILILIVAIFIASLGLNTNSTAVIIGAMLISPLMGPIIGIGLAVGILDFDLLKRSGKNLAMATLFSVITSCIFFMISPVDEGHSELLARTSPTIYDVLIGLFGGAAGILATGSRVKGNVIPGVAIATALMPPLCTVGYGLATMQPKYFLGALYLFFINSVYIATATTIGVKFMKYKVKQEVMTTRQKRIRRIMYAFVLITMIPACFLTWIMYTESKFQSNCSKFVNSEFNFPDTQVLSYKGTTVDGKPMLTVALMGRTLPTDSLTLALTDRLPFFHLAGTTLRIIQGDNSRLDPTQTTSAMLRDMYQMTQQTIMTQQTTIDSLRHINARLNYNDSISARIAPEIKVVFPQVAGIAISKNVVCDIAAGRLDTIDVALVQYSQPLSAASEEKFQKYLEARLDLSHVTIVSDSGLLPKAAAKTDKTHSGK